MQNDTGSAAVIPAWMVEPLGDFAAPHLAAIAAGQKALRRANIGVLGLARNCSEQLAANLGRVMATVSTAESWRLHVEANDCTDATPQVLEQFVQQHPAASYRYRELGTQQWGAQFAGPRTEAMASYRSDCLRVATGWDDKQLLDYVVVIDLDAWGGWVHGTIEAGVGWLTTTPSAFGMASVSLFEHNFPSGKQWAHYDCWALRLNEYWDDYTAGLGGWKHSWLPAVGSSPIPVRSAFGGLAVYNAGDFLKGIYSGSDCEHVPFHRSIAEATGRSMHLCPSMRTLMHWVPDK